MDFRTVFSYTFWVVEQVQPHMSLLNIIEHGKLKYCGHMLRSGNSIEKVVVQGKVEEKSRREDQKVDG